MKLKKEYKRIFNSNNENWQKDMKMNLFFLKCRQKHLNDMLKARGHLMLNEAYDLLGFPRTAAGAVIGWVYEGDKNFISDIVDFGKCEVVDSGIEIVFNVHGNILDKLEEEP